ncbi:hypothetical protein [Kitasatospora griseola]|uniref:hypothetical protein n=1 Tax=Kitasatospora griseola TaxID=2064 RepID=UPI003821EE5E
MNHRNKVQLFLSIFVGGLLPIIVGWKLGWSVWLWVMMSLTVMALVGLFSVALAPQTPAPEPQVDHGRPQPEPPAEPPFHETRLENLLLPSCVPDYDFRFSATVRWRSSRSFQTSPHASLAAVAVDAVVARARQVTVGEHPARTDLAAFRLNGALGTLVHDSSGLVAAMAVAVVVTLTEEDRTRLEKLAVLRKAEEEWEHQRQYERSRCAYVGGEVLKSTGSAVVWWLSRHEEDIEGAVSLIGPLAELAAAANDSEVPEVFRRYVDHRPGETEDLLADPASDAEFAEQLRQESQFGSGGGEDSALGQDEELVDLLGRVPQPASGPDSEDSAARHVADLMDNLGLRPDSDRGQVWLHRVGRATEQAVQAETDEAPADTAGPAYTARSVFVAGPDYVAGPADAAEPDWSGPGTDHSGTSPLFDSVPPGGHLPPQEPTGE